MNTFSSAELCRVLTVVIIINATNFSVEDRKQCLMFVVVFVKRKTFCVCRGRLKGQRDVIAMRTFHWLLEKFNIGESIIITINRLRSS